LLFDTWSMRIWSWFSTHFSLYHNSLYQSHNTLCFIFIVPAILIRQHILENEKVSWFSVVIKDMLSDLYSWTERIPASSWNVKRSIEIELIRQNPSEIFYFLVFSWKIVRLGLQKHMKSTIWRLSFDVR
jgi:hypothetical protein